MKKIQTKMPRGSGTGAAAFLLPVLVLLAAYAVIGVFPFGEKSLLLVDMHNEYIDYFAFLNRTVRGDGSFLRSWQMGMGLNLMGLLAFYTASGLNLLLLLAPVGWLTEAVLVLTLLKVGLCGLTFRWYARYLFGERVKPRILVLACAAYALCGYNLAYSSNIMWLDGVAMLPLVCQGVEKLLREKRWQFFAGCLIYTFVASYYIGYMIGVFSFLYFTIRYFCENNSILEYMKGLKVFLGAALLAAACCAFLLLPAFLQLSHGQGSLWQIPLGWDWQLSPLALAGKLLPGSYDSLTDAGTPNLYTTVAAVVGAGLFFAGRHIPKREKLLFGGLLAFLALSFCVRLLDLAWHAFEDPTWFPARYSFVFSFLLLVLALRGMEDRQAPSRPQAAAAGGVVLLLFVGAVCTGTASVIIAAAGCLLVLLYGALAVGGSRTLAAVLLPLFVLTELAGNAILTVHGMDKEFGYKTRDSYYSFRDAVLPAVEWVEQNGDGVSRMELVQQRNANGGMALGFRGISHYSTTTDQNLNTLLRALGYNTGTINEVRFAPVTPLTNGLLGIRHVVSGKPVGEGYQMVQDTEQVDIYLNTLAFPVAFAADRQAMGWKGDVADPFVYQNEWLSAVAGREVQVFLPLQVELRLQNLEESQRQDGLAAYKQIDAGQPGVLQYTVRNDTGQPAYAFLPVANRRFAGASAYVDGEPIGRELGYRANTVLSLGAGETAVLRISADDTIWLRGEYFYALDLAAAGEAAAEAQQNAFVFTRFDDTYLSGHITMPAGGGTLVTTFPYDRGWSAWVDGEKVETGRFAGVFLALALEGDGHHVVMRYTPPGLVAGCVISGAAIAGWCLLVWYRKHQKKQGRLTP